MISLSTFFTILLMAMMTYSTRILGFLALHNKTLSPKMNAVMTAAPGCVLITVIAPYFASNKPADLAALAITLLAATRLSFLPTVLIGIIAAAFLRHTLI